MASPEQCCSAGTRTIIEDVRTEQNTTYIFTGLLNNAVSHLRANPGVSIRELKGYLLGSPVTFRDSFGFKGEPISFYRPGRPDPADQTVSTERMALAVAVCVTRAKDGVCSILRPIEIGETPVEVTS